MAGFDDEEVGKIQLAVDEACTNVVRHAYDPSVRDKKDIEITVEFDSEAFVVTVTDRGKGFDPQAVPEPDMEHLRVEMRPGGLGIHLMKILMDKVEFSIQPYVRNQVRLTKYRHAPKPQLGEFDRQLIAQRERERK